MFHEPSPRVTPARSSYSVTLSGHGWAQVLLERLEVEEDGVLRHQDEVELGPYITETLNFNSEVLQHLKKKEAERRICLSWVTHTP